MKVLFVTPVEAGSGETITALHIAEQLAARGDTVCFLASVFAGSFLTPVFPQAVQLFTDDGAYNRALWESTVRAFQPDAIVFADYPLLFFSSGSAPLAVRDEWAQSLSNLDTCLVTLDHTGFAQRAMGLFFGPPHLSFHYETIPAVPACMHLLLPCPMHEPGHLPGRKGTPFRDWDVPLSIPEEQRRALRARYLARDDDFLIFHSVPLWAWLIARAYGLPYFQYLPEILTYYLAGVPRPVTVVSVNNGQLLAPSADPQVRIVNSTSLPKSEYEALIFASDLMITENKLSISMGKAICGLVPCVVLNNSYRLRALLAQLQGPLRQIVKAMEAWRPGAIFPYDYFPGGTEELAAVGLYHGNSLTQGFRELEIYGDEATRDALHDLLIDPPTREALRAQQVAYVDKVRRLDDAPTILHRLVAAGREAE